MFDQIALGIGVFVMILIALFYFIPMTVGACQYWASIYAWIKRIRNTRKAREVT